VLPRVRSYVRTHHVGLLALFIALGGTSYAAVQLPAGSVRGKQLARNAVSSPKVRNGSLLMRDFKAGQLPAGAKGDAGAAGPQGPAGPNGAKGDTGLRGPTGLKGNKGDTGTVDTSNFYDKSESDGRFLGLGAKAADADQLDGIDSGGFLQGRGRALFNRKAFTVTSGTVVLDVPGWGSFNAYGKTAPDGHQHAFVNLSGGPLSVFKDTGGSDPGWSMVADGGLSATPIIATSDLVHWTIVRGTDANTQILTATVASADEGAVFEVTVQALVQP
jgi:Collagen triple helix repeat (20 copies)